MFNVKTPPQTTHTLTQELSVRLALGVYCCCYLLGLIYKLYTTNKLTSAR